MVPQAKPRKPRNSSKVNLAISLAFHAVIVMALGFFAAREGLLGKQLKKIAVEMVKEQPPVKPKEPEKPKAELPKIEPPKVAPTKAALAPKVETPRTEAVPQVAAIAAPPTVAPPAVEVPSFVFEGGKAVETSSDPNQIYRGLVEYALRSKWERPPDIDDKDFVAEVEVSIDRNGRIRDTEWKNGSGHQRWDDSVRAALAATSSLSRPPPANFPARIVIRFDVQDVPEFTAP
jgi:TonB family protein